MKIPFGAEIDLVLSMSTSQDPNVLRDLSSLKFHYVKLGTAFLIDNETIKHLGELEYLLEVDLSGTSVSSLKPFLKNPRLQALEVWSTKVSAEEILKLKRLTDLDKLSFGPVAKPQQIFDKLATTNKIRDLGFKDLNPIVRS